jgi:hypothetical protein
MSNKLGRMEKLTPEERLANQRASKREWYKRNREAMLQYQKEYYHKNSDENTYKKYKNFYDKWHGVIEQLSAQLQVN